MKVFRQDRKAIKKLGGMEAMWGYKVIDWDHRGHGMFRKTFPGSWSVASRILAARGIKPLNHVQAENIRRRRTERGLKAYETRLARQASTEKRPEDERKAPYIYVSSTASGWPVGDMDCPEKSTCSSDGNHMDEERRLHSLVEHLVKERFENDFGINGADRLIFYYVYQGRTAAGSHIVEISMRMKRTVVFAKVTLGAADNEYEITFVEDHPDMDSGVSHCNRF